MVGMGYANKSGNAFSDLNRDTLAPFSDPENCVIEHWILDTTVFP